MCTNIVRLCVAGRKRVGREVMLVSISVEAPRGAKRIKSERVEVSWGATESGNKKNEMEEGEGNAKGKTEWRWREGR